MRDVAERCFYLSTGNWQKDIHGLDAPIRGSIDGRVFAVNLAGAAYLWPLAEMTNVPARVSSI